MLRIPWTVPRWWWFAVLLLMATGLMGGLWAGGGTTSLTITAANSGGSVATITQLASAASLVSKGNSQRIQGVGLYDITDIASGFENSLTLRFYVLNPHEMGLAFGSEKTFLELSVTDYSNPNLVYAAATASTQAGSVTLLPRNVPAGTTKLKLRGDIVIPGGRAGGAKKPGSQPLKTLLETTQR